MAGQSSSMFGWNWTEESVLGSQVFRQALMESCDLPTVPVGQKNSEGKVIPDQEGLKKLYQKRFCAAYKANL